MVGFDAQWNQLWYSVLDGWNGVNSVSASISSDGSTATLIVSDGQAGAVTYTVPTTPTAGQFRVKGETSEGRVVQFIGTMADFQPSQSALVPEGESVSDTEGVDAVFAELG